MDINVFFNNYRNKFILFIFYNFLIKKIGNFVFLFKYECILGIDFTYIKILVYKVCGF